MMDTASMYTYIFIILMGGLLALLLKIYLMFSYFSRRNIPFERAKGLLGSGALSSSMPMLLWDMYKKSGKNKLYGFFLLWSQSILIKDLELIKHVLVKNNSSFYNRGMWHNEKRDPLSAHLFALEGQLWKNLRIKLSPAFTSGKMKMMYPTISNFGDKLVSYIASYPETESLDCFKLTAKYTLSNIASTAFGIESNSFEEKSKFAEMAIKFNEPSIRVLLRGFLGFQLKALADLLPFYTLTPSDITSFYMSLTKEAMSYRENNNITRNDFLQMLIDLKNKGFIDQSSNDGVCLTMNQVSAQAFVFIVGGFETSAIAEAWVLYELARNPDVQQRLQAEIDALDDWTYENILGLEYLEKVQNEAVRMYPSVPFIVRKCNDNFEVPDSDIVIEKGSEIVISLYGLHRDPDLFPDPEKFDPERFNANPTHEIKPYSYLPFGDGPRFCIGMRFAKMQTKIAIAKLMKHYTVEPDTEKTPIPMVLHPQSFMPMAKDGIWLRFKKRNKEQ